MANDLMNPTDSGKVSIVYFLFLAGVIVPLTPLIGVVMAYISRDEAEPWLQSHYTFQIRTFWISFLFGLTALLLSLVLIGMLLFPVILVWYIIRCVKGLDGVSKGDPVPDPESWMFG